MNDWKDDGLNRGGSYGVKKKDYVFVFCDKVLMQTVCDRFW